MNFYSHVKKTDINSNKSTEIKRGFFSNLIFVKNLFKHQKNLKNPEKLVLMKANSRIQIIMLNVG